MKSHNINTTSPAKTLRVTYIYLVRILNPEDGGNTTIRSIRNCVTSHQNRTINNTADKT